MNIQKIISVLEDLVYEDINNEEYWKAIKDAKALIKELKQALTIPDVSDSDLRFKSENEKNIIYDSISDKDICMWFDEDTRDWLLDILNRNPGSLPF